MVIEICKILVNSSIKVIQIHDVGVTLIFSMEIIKLTTILAILNND